jgi:hypothetical protein
MCNVQGTANFEGFDGIEKLVLDVNIGVKLLAELGLAPNKTGFHIARDYFGSGRYLLVIWTEFNFV